MWIAPLERGVLVSAGRGCSVELMDRVGLRADVPHLSCWLRNMNRFQQLHICDSSQPGLVITAILGLLVFTTMSDLFESYPCMKSGMLTSCRIDTTFKNAGRFWLVREAQEVV